MRCCSGSKELELGTLSIQEIPNKMNYPRGRDKSDIAEEAISAYLGLATQKGGEQASQPLAFSKLWRMKFHSLNQRNSSPLSWTIPRSKPCCG
jgi:hypothetical protein